MTDNMEAFYKRYADILVRLAAEHPEAVTERRRATVEDGADHETLLLIDPWRHLPEPDDFLRAVEGAVIILFDDGSPPEVQFYDSAEDAWTTYLPFPEDRPRVEIGQRVRFIAPFDVFREVIPTGTTGTIVETEDDEYGALGVRLDEPVEVLEAWDNTVMIYAASTYGDADPRSAAEFAATLLSIDDNQKQEG